MSMTSDQPFSDTNAVTIVKNFSYSETPERRPYGCPVCNGKGEVGEGFYRQNAMGQWTGSSAAGTEKCRSCQGTGIVWG